jgi:hypothetical protein
MTFVSENKVFGRGNSAEAEGKSTHSMELSERNADVFVHVHAAANASLRPTLFELKLSTRVVVTS